MHKKTLHLPTAKHSQSTNLTACCCQQSHSCGTERDKTYSCLGIYREGLEMQNNYCWLLFIKENHIIEYFKIICDLCCSIFQGIVYFLSFICLYEMEKIRIDVRFSPQTGSTFLEHPKSAACHLVSFHPRNTWHTDFSGTLIGFLSSYFVVKS